jgi:hypothetical protein
MSGIGMNAPSCHGAFDLNNAAERCCTGCTHKTTCYISTPVQYREHVIEVTPEELEEWNKKMAQNATDKQVGGNHYKDLPIQPIEYIHANAMGYMEGNVVKYISRWRKKNGIADLEKAKHYIELLIELENRKLDGECDAGKTD